MSDDSDLVHITSCHSMTEASPYRSITGRGLFELLFGNVLQIILVFDLFLKFGVDSEGVLSELLVWFNCLIRLIKRKDLLLL